ncbi:hypothetical protein [Clostridium formicaceticum]|uniref:Uncharacterized protein n=1 Tax=Clostridium formicaceticum TaxID=1497 RepID=A0AAC9RLJ9_9CLOT|nr:hypothetical protein [Clostridium formicaceticum]AOY77056.1 hypothetical protein BJL90_15070 [Clostridium formicaceticum]ARE87558.1 hypothetical protein CLFO_19580 [Clostridium formicaceticum]
MKSYLENEAGSIAAICFMLGVTVLMLALSTLTVYVNDYAAVVSNSDAIKAYYLAEMAAQETLWELMETTEALVLVYFSHLKQHKINYMRNVEKEIYEAYHPPVFNNYLESYLISHLSNFKKEAKNPFLDYSHPHRYESKLNYNAAESTIVIEGTGVYNNARRRVKMEVKVPYQVQEGIDTYHLPSTVIYPPRISGYYQIVL